jgi:hypothetical protein
MEAGSRIGLMGDYDGHICHRNHLDFEPNYITARKNHIRVPRSGQALDTSRIVRYAVSFKHR